jgi:hypothetical protein
VIEWPDADTIPVDQIPAVLAQLAAFQTTLAARLMVPALPQAKAENDKPDRMLTVDEAAVLLRRSRQWIYRHSHLPFVKRISRKSLLCSETGVKRWLATR